jgi:acetyltransferase
MGFAVQRNRGPTMSRDQPALVHALRLSDGRRVAVRPVCPQDAELIQAYVRGLAPASRYSRFFGPLRELHPAELDRVTHLNHRTQTALIIEAFGEHGLEMIGEARYAMTPDGQACEFAVSVADAWRGRGVGTLLLADLECRARSFGARSLVGDVLHSNEAMKALARETGFHLTGPHEDARLVRIVKDIGHPETRLPCERLMTTGLPIAA